MPIIRAPYPLPAAVTAEETGSLRTLAQNYAILGASTAGYVTPTLAQRDAFKAIWADIKLGNIAAARTAADPYGYDVVTYQDTETSRLFTLLRERTARTRYWGLYVWGRDAAKTTRVVGSTHPQSDLNTEVQVADLLIKANPTAGLFSGTHRDASTTLDADGDTITDVANASDPPSSIFQAITEATVGATHTMYEPHGFGAGQVPPLGSAHYRGADVTTLPNAPVGKSQIVIDPGTTATLALPPAVKVGDRVFAFLVIRDSAAAVTVPTGWTLVTPKQSDGTGIQGNLYEHVVVAGDFTGTTPNSFTWSWSVSVKAILAMVSYGSAGIVDVSAGAIEPGTSVTTHSTASITTTVADTVLVAFYAISNSTVWSATGATGATNRILNAETTATGSATVGIYDTDDFTRAVGTYTASAQNSGASSFGTFFILALRPGATVREVQGVLSSGALPQPQYIYDLETKYLNAGYAVVANDGTWPYVAAGNAQGISTRAAGGRFVHFEQLTSVRTDATLRATFMDLLIS